MHPAAEGLERERTIPRLSRDWDPSGCSLSPAEGFLLSRIDGHTSWMQLREIGGIPPAEVDACLERWLSEGVVFVSDAELVADPDAKGQPSANGDADPRLDPGIDLGEAMQRQILDFEAALDRSYFELLDVERNADDKTIKQAYFRLSKVYHPDRYFRSNLGSFKPRLDRIFRKLVEAYELLTDPTTRAEIERTMLVSPPPQPLIEPEPTVSTGDDSAASPQPSDRPRVKTPRKLTKRQTLERLRRHFKLPEDVMAERRAQAAGFFKSAMVAAHRERWSEAAPCARLAITFDPWNDEYRNQFAEIQANYQQQRAEQMLAESDSFDSAQRNDALRILEEVLAYRPADATLHERVARLAMDNGDQDKAVEYIQTACELDPESAPLHLAHAKILRRFGLRERAFELLTRAAELEPENRDVKAELLDMRRRRR
jgi:tetratricopeptide (TPR) repeat protein